MAFSERVVREGLMALSRNYHEIMACMLSDKLPRLAFVRD